MGTLAAAARLAETGSTLTAIERPPEPGRKPAAFPGTENAEVTGPGDDILTLVSRGSEERIELARRVIQLANGKDVPMTFKELARIKKMGKTPEERSLPLEDIAALVIERDSVKKRK